MARCTDAAAHGYEGRSDGIGDGGKALQDAGYELPGDVTITSVCDEEGGGNGSIQGGNARSKADGVVNCEPTDDT